MFKQKFSLLSFLVLIFALAIEAKVPTKKSSKNKNTKTIKCSTKKTAPKIHHPISKQSTLIKQKEQQKADSAIMQTPTLQTTLPIKKIRVLLNEYPLDKENTFSIKSPSGFVLESPVKSSNCAVYQSPEIRLLYRNGKMHMRCKDGKYRKLKYNSVEICNTGQKLLLGTTTYQGSLIFLVSHQSNKVFVINKVALEDYVCAVVGSESTPSWPLAFQKIQAIMSRTFALHRMKQNRLQGSSQCVYDIKNTNFHQVYNGHHNYSKIRQAVDETAGLVVTHHNNIAFTEFDICCGGIATNKMRKIDRSQQYLCKQTPCAFCTTSPYHHWKIDQQINTFAQTVAKHPALQEKLSFINAKNPLTDVKIVDKDAAGVVYKVRLISKKGRTASLTGNELKRCFPVRIKSLAFTIKKIRDRIVIAGKGYGHLRGVCQWGCKDLVDRGWNIRKILKFYYPGTEIKHLVA